MRTRAHYEKLFAAYPDVVTLPEFQAMLGGIGDSTARKIMRANKVKHFYIIGAKIYPYSDEVIILQGDGQFYYFEKIVTD